MLVLLNACTAAQQSANRSSSNSVIERDIAACRASPTRCVTLADEYGRRDARARDVNAAARLSALGCELRQGDSCLASSGYYQALRDGPRALQMAEQGCSLSHGESCAEVAALVFDEGPLHNAERALSSSRRGCDLGSALGCSNHAVSLRQFRGPFDPARREVARYLQRGCTEQNQHGCVVLARSMEEGADGIERDAGRAFELFKTACQRAAPSGCFEYGMRVVLGGQHASEFSDGVRAVGIACENNEPAACRTLARVLSESDHPDAPQRVAALFDRACALEDGESCMMLTILTLRGQGVAQDVERAFPLLERVCTEGNAVACAELARFSMAQTRPDGRAVVRFADRGCELGAAGACAMSMQARMRFPTTGGRSDALELARTVCNGPRRAQCSVLVNAMVYAGVEAGNEQVPRDVLPLLDAACAADGWESCVSASSLRLAGLYGISYDATRAGTDLLRACQAVEGASAVACDLASGMSRTGVGIERDLVRSLSRARRACDLGHTASCGVAAMMVSRGEGGDANLAEAARLRETECNEQDFCARSIDDERAVTAMCRAAPLVAIGGSVEGETQGDDRVRASCGSLARSPEQVFRIEVRRRETVRIDAQRLSEGYDPVLYVRRACADERSEIACNDDPLPGLNERSRVERTFEPGTYYLFVDGFGATNHGRFRLSVTSVAGSATSANSGNGPRV